MSELRVEDFEVRKLNYSSGRWRVFYIPTNAPVTVWRTTVLFDGRAMPFKAPAAFDRKRDAVAWMRDELPRLLAEKNRGADVSG